MKVFLVVQTLVVVLTLAAKPPTTKPFPESVCHKKIVNCCFKYSQCGVKVVKKTLWDICPVKVCKQHCFKVCTTKIVKGKKQNCVKTVSFKIRCYKHPWEPEVCVKVPTYKEVCTAVVQKVKLCERKCHRKCSVVAKKCSITKIFHATKFCSKLSCGLPTFEGKNTKPPVVVSPKNTFIKKTKPVNYGVATPLKH